MAVAIDDIYTLTPMQAGLLYHTLQDPTGSMYLEQGRCRLVGRLDAARLIAAWRQVAGRHDALRTCVRWKGLRHPVQVVHREVELPVTTEDWAGVEYEDREQRLASWLDRDLEAGFDLTLAPLLRVALLRLAESEHLVVWTFHHLILDAWSEANMLIEVMRVYESDSVTAGPAPKYRDYVRWLKTLDFSDSLVFWRDYLKGARLQPVARGAREKNQTILRQVAPEVERRVRALAAGAHTTVHSILLSLWALFLLAWSRRIDALFGVTVSGRSPDAPGAFEQIGALFNTVPFRIRLDDTELVTDLIRRAHANYASLAPHEVTPLSVVRQAAQAERDAEIFDTVAVFLNHGFIVKGQMIGDCEVRDVRCSSRSSYGLTFRVMERAPMTLELLYDESILEAERANLILDGLYSALQMMASNPDRPVGEVAKLLSNVIRPCQDGDAETVSKPRLAEVRPHRRQVKR
jgi:condensation domain-containing protein